MRRNVIIGVILLFFSILTFSKMLRPGFYPMHDDMQAMRLLQMHSCVVDGQIPCRWVPDMGFGYGYPQFNYYAPLPYYAMEVFNLSGFSILSSVKIGFMLSVVVGVVGMYLLSSNLWGHYAGIVSAAFYALIPYRSVDLWVRGAMGELWGMAFFPFVFLAVWKAVNKKKYSEVYLALSLSALLTSHNISILIFLPFTAVWIFYLLYQKYGPSPLLFKLKNLRSLIIGSVWAILLSSFFILPAWFERNLVQIDSLTGGYFDYRLHFASISQLFTQTYWNYGSSQLGRYDEIFLGIGIIHWTIAALSVATLLVLRRTKTAKTVLLITLMAFVAAFMAHPKSMMIWEILKPLKYLQFPWRFLLASTFLFSLAAGSIIVPIKRKLPQARRLSFLLIVIVIFFNISYFQPSEWLEISDSQKFSGQEWLRQQTISIYDYLPDTAQKAPDEPAPFEPILISGEAQFSEIRKGSDWYEFSANVNSDLARLRLPIYYFPNWTVEVGGERKDVTFDNELGLITFEVGSGLQKVHAELRDTPLRKLSNIISLLSLLFIPYYLTISKRKMKDI